MKRNSLTLVGLALLTASAYADVNSGNIVISGTVLVNSSIVVTPVAGSDALNIANGVTDQTVATVKEKSNNKTGYSVTLTTANAPTGNAAFLKSADGNNNDHVTYTMKYNGTAVTLVNGSATVTSVSEKTVSNPTAKDLQVTIPASWVNTDTYQDTITFTLTNN